MVLDDYQLEYLEEVDYLKDKSTCRKGRHIGMSLAVGLGLAKAAVGNEHATFICFSRTKEQASIIANYARTFILSSPITAEFVDQKKTNADNLYLKNGSNIQTRSVGFEGRNVIGKTISQNGALLWDEVAATDRKSIERILPMGLGGGEHHIGTPLGFNSFFAWTHQPEQKYDPKTNPFGYKQWHIPCSRCPRMTEDHIEHLRKLYSRSRFRTEVLGCFDSGIGAVIDSDSVERCSKNDLPIAFKGHRWSGVSGKLYYYGLDPSSLKGDAMVLVIVEYDPDAGTIKLVDYWSWINPSQADSNPDAYTAKDSDDILNHIVGIRKDYPCQKIWIDTTGGRDYIAKRLLNEWCFNVEEVIFSVNKKAQLYENLATAIRTDKVIIPPDTNITDQLYSLRYAVKEGEELSRVQYLEDGADDFVAALSLVAELCSVGASEDYFYCNAWSEQDDKQRKVDSVA